MVTLNKPAAGNTDWAGSVNSNWSSIESALNGGPSMTLSAYENIPYGAGLGNVTALTGVTAKALYVPFRVEGHVSFNTLALEVSRQTSGSNLFTVHAAIYTYVDATQLRLLGSASNSYSNTATASVSGTRQLLITGFETAATSLTPGMYNLMLYFSAANTLSMNYHLRGATTVGQQGLIGPGANNVTTATGTLSSLPYRGVQFMGRYSVTTVSPLATVSATHVQQWSSGVAPYFRLQA